MVSGSKLDVVDGWKSFLKIVIEMLQGKTKENPEKKIGKLNLRKKKCWQIQSCFFFFVIIQ